MTVKQDLEKARAAAEAAEGTYLTFAQATQDPEAKAMFQSMADDVSLHALLLQDRVAYVSHPGDRPGPG